MCRDKTKFFDRKMIEFMSANHSNTNMLSPNFNIENTTYAITITAIV